VPSMIYQIRSVLAANESKNFFAVVSAPSEHVGVHCIAPFTNLFVLKYMLIGKELNITT